MSTTFLTKKMNYIILTYTILLFIGSIFDYKKRIIPDTINILIVLLAIVSGNIHFSGLLLGFILLIISMFKNFIGGGDIKFLMATGLLIGFFDTYIMFSKSIILMFLFILFLYIKSKILKEKWNNDFIPLLPFFFIANILYLLNLILN